MTAVEQIGITGRLLSNLEQFFEFAGPDEVWMLSEVLHQWQDRTCYLAEDTRTFEAILMEVAAIQDDYRDREKASQGRAAFQGVLDDATRGGLARGALKFAREMPLERVVELHEHLGRLIAVENGAQPVKLGDPAGGAS